MNGTACLLLGDVIAELASIPSETVHTCVTSPPYWALRDYGMDGQIGLEKSPEEYIERMVAVFRDVRRVLRADGTLWVNIGDSYSGSGRAKGSGATGPLSKKQRTNAGAYFESELNGHTPDGCKSKDLVGIPWMLAFALRADGWYLRSDIIWSKPNPMPESVTDRPTKAHEYLFLLSKSATYYYDHEAIREKAIYKGQDESGFKSAGLYNGKYGADPTYAKTNKLTGGAYAPPGQAAHSNARKTDKQRGHSRRHAGFNDRWDLMSKEEQAEGGRNKRSVWEVATHPYEGAHFATFPPDLIRPCILAGSPEGGTVLDPFFGSGTTGAVALEYGRNIIGIELNSEYMELARKRIAPFLAQGRLTL